MKFLATMTLLVGLTSTAAAQETAAQETVKLEPLVVEGRRQVPVALLVPRSASSHTQDSLKTSFVRGVVRAVSRSPF